MPAWIELPIPTPPPWWTLTQVAPAAVFSERVQDRPVGDRVGAVAHRLGLAVRGRNRAGVEVIAADHDRRRDGARADELVDREARFGAVAVAEPADPWRAVPGRRHARERARASAGAARRRGTAAGARRRWRRCRPGRPRARPSGRGRRRGRRAAGYRPGRSPGMRRPPLRPPHRPPREGCFHSRRHSCRRGRIRAAPSTCRAIDSRARRRYSSGSEARNEAASATDRPTGTYPVSGSWAAVWSVTRSK